mmetsp:Transcript_1744/g.3989  ORF Transcript_1744/g.3989 Transcript_1744/m.3989 type:complete len:214 (-) Transcript_1744:293-934(-)
MRAARGRRPETRLLVVAGGATRRRRRGGSHASKTSRETTKHRDTRSTNAGGRQPRALARKLPEPEQRELPGAAASIGERGRIGRGLCGGAVDARVPQARRRRRAAQGFGSGGRRRGLQDDLPRQFIARRPAPGQHPRDARRDARPGGLFFGRGHLRRARREGARPPRARALRAHAPRRRRRGAAPLQGHGRRARVEQRLRHGRGLAAGPGFFL